MKLSIAVPCFNEAETLPILLERFNEVIQDKPIEVVIVNNGSSDGTAELLEKFAPKYSFMKIVTVKKNQGYGYGILQGLKECSGDFIGWTHADMQTDPSDVVKAYEILLKKNAPCYVKGNRHGRSLFDDFFTKGMSLFESLYFQKDLQDINAQPNIFPKEFFQTWQNPPYDFSLDLFALYTARQQNLEVIRFPVLFPERLYGHSHWNTDGLKSKWKLIKRTILFSHELKNRLENKK